MDEKENIEVKVDSEVKIDSEVKLDKAETKAETKAENPEPTPTPTPTPNPEPVIKPSTPEIKFKQAKCFRCNKDGWIKTDGYENGEIRNRLIIRALPKPNITCFECLDREVRPY